ERLEPELEKTREKLKTLKVENLEEQKRISDVKEKLTRLLADCDLLVVPRVTLLDLAKKELVPNRVHRFNDAQFAALQEFLKKGKPVMFLLGPPNEPKRAFDISDLEPDQVEQARDEMGFKIPPQTVIFDSELKSFAQRRGSFLIAGVAKADIPPVQFDWQRLVTPGKRTTLQGAGPHPIRASVRLMSKSQGTDKDLAYKLRHDRPVYFLKSSIDPQGAAGMAA